MIELCFSILASDFAHLADEIAGDVQHRPAEEGAGKGRPDGGCRSRRRAAAERFCLRRARPHADSRSWAAASCSRTRASAVPPSEAFDSSPAPCASTS